MKRKNKTTSATRSEHSISDDTDDRDCGGAVSKTLLMTVIVM